MTTSSLGDRYTIWFSDKGFTGHTEEKKETNRVLAELVDKLGVYAPEVLRNEADLTRPPVIMDIGSGTGVVTKSLADSVHATLDATAHGNQSRHAQVLAVDVFSDHVGLTRGRFHRLDDIEAKQQDFSKEDAPAAALGSGKKAAIALASHVAYYPKDLGSFVNNIMKSLQKNGAAIFIHDSHESDANALKDKYSQVQEYLTTDKLAQTLRTSGIQTQALKFNAALHFPKITQQDWDRMAEAENYSATTNPYGSNEKLLTARALAEFVIHRRLEDMEMPERKEYLTDLKTMLEKKNYDLNYCNVVHVCLPPGHDRAMPKKLAYAMRETAQKLGLAESLQLAA
ncbi:MAG: class I SAM-dependent methyltransferase [Rickettsiales bacterium]|nr:class I SAM-dependent methyltransferase [Rickettsiales bacterium]